MHRNWYVCKTKSYKNHHDIWNFNVEIHWSIRTAKLRIRIAPSTVKSTRILLWIIRLIIPVDVTTAVEQPSSKDSTAHLSKGCNAKTRISSWTLTHPSIRYLEKTYCNRSNRTRFRREGWHWRWIQVHSRDAAVITGITWSDGRYTWTWCFWIDSGADHYTIWDVGFNWHRNMEIGWIIVLDQ